ncbi:MAG: hypothetical protein ABI330_02930 [Caldimonas sp.]
MLLDLQRRRHGDFVVSSTCTVAPVVALKSAQATGTYFWSMPNSPPRAITRQAIFSVVRVEY